MKKTIQKAQVTRLGMRLICQTLMGFLILFFFVLAASGQDTPIPSQSRTLIPSEEQIRLAQSAAPSEISQQATIYVL